ncbi:MAG: LytTR family DNA-binding domain-containing protein [Chitinophagaceae bacterium]|jgi:two-component system LytT family response regulator|nr:LytTR family DNA-binding domain-containing protein [Chitinophagaceae bacterium]
MQAEVIRTVIIDDEPKGRSSLTKLLALVCPQIVVVGDFGQPDEAVQALPQLDIDLLLLDINMPGKNGFELLDAIQPVNFRVIFITAHSEYAIQAFRYSAVDYLLKPIDPDELILAVRKISTLKQQGNPTDQSTHMRMLLEQFNSVAKNDLRKIVLASQEGLSLEPIDSIVYLESQGSYTSFHFSEKRSVLVSRTLGDYEQLLVPHHFFRIHRQYLINMRHVQKVLRHDGGYVVLSSGVQLELSRRNREGFFKLLETLYI